MKLYLSDVLVAVGKKVDSVLEGKNRFAVVLHANDEPAILLRLVVECLAEGADLVYGPEQFENGPRALRRSRRWQEWPGSLLRTLRMPGVCLWNLWPLFQPFHL
jgi:hypothetical protein